MTYYWTRHALYERLPERSSLSQAEINGRLLERRYVVPREYYGQKEEHHLIWDYQKGHLIDVPVVYPGDTNVIVSILPVTIHGSGYAEHQLAEAEEAWRGEAFYEESLPVTDEYFEAVEVILAKRWVKRSGWSNYRDIYPLLSWFVFDQRVARIGAEGLLQLFREKLFRTTIQKLLQEWEKDIPALVDGDTPIIHIKKRGASRIIPLEFFLSKPTS